MMFPTACDASVLSKIDLFNPKIEHVASYTTFKRNDSCTMLDLSLFFNEEIKMKNLPNNIGTTFVSKPETKFALTNEDLTGYYSDNYELNIKLHVKKIIYKKVQIKSVSKFTPKVVF